MPTSRDTTYAIGRIYKLFSNVDDNYYWGSTGGTLRLRKSIHLKDARTKAESNRPVYQWIRDIGQDNVRIQEAITFNDITRGELEVKEDEYISNSKGDEKCLNCKKAYRTSEERVEYNKQYRKDNPEKVKAWDKQKYDKHKDTINTKKKQRYENDEELRENIQEKSREYYHEHKEESNERNKKWREENAEKIRIQRATKKKCPHCDKEITPSHLARHIRESCKGKK